MPHQNVTLREVTREDVTRITRWLSDEEVSESWFGRYSYGDPAHLGYHPEQMEAASDQQWGARLRGPGASNPVHLHPGG